MVSLIKKHPYITATISATLLALVVWFCVPKEYTATTEISDEYKEVDISIGLNRLRARAREISGTVNSGINDMEVYCMVLKSEDFARIISHKQIPGKKITYGEYLNDKDTIGAVSDNINYIYDSEQATLTIALTDKNALVASQMLYIVTNELQHTITTYRRDIAEKTLANLKFLRKKAELKYKEAQEKLISYTDAHLYLNTKKYIQEREALEKNAMIDYKHYEDMTVQYTRQLALTKRSYSSFAIIKANTVPTSISNNFLAYLMPIWMIIMALTKGVILLRRRYEENCKIDIGGIFAPWYITMGVWGGMLILFLFIKDLLDPLTDQFYISISLWLPIFVITSFVTFNLLEHKTKPFPSEGIPINKIFFYPLFIIVLLFSPMYVYNVWEAISTFETEDMLKNARLLSVHGEGHGFLNYTIVIAQSLLLTTLWSYPRIPKWQVLAIIFCCLLNALAIMEKGSIFLVILCSSYVLFERGVIKIRTIGFMGVFILLFFYFFNLMREGGESEYAQNESLLDFIAMYVMSPPVAFCKTVREVIPQFGINTFEVIYDHLNRLGIGNYEIHEKRQEFVLVPMPTNVYTIMQPFFRDFGYIGVAFFAWIYGLLSGVLYRFSCNGNPFCICLYTYMVELLILQFFQENIFLTLAFVVQLVMLVFILTQDIVKISHVQRRQ